MQQVNCVPLLLSNNQFSVLNLHELEIDKDISDTSKLIEPTWKQLSSSLEISPATCRLCKPKWEKQMPRTLKIHSLEPGPNCIMLLIHLKTMDMMEEAWMKLWSTLVLWATSSIKTLFETPSCWLISCRSRSQSIMSIGHWMKLGASTRLWI